MVEGYVDCTQKVDRNIHVVNDHEDQYVMLVERLHGYIYNLSLCLPVESLFDPCSLFHYASSFRCDAILMSSKHVTHRGMSPSHL